MYLVTGSWIELGALLTPEQVGTVLEDTVLPSLEMLVHWGEEGRLHGGVFAGERETAFILMSDSAEEVGQLLTSLPFWGMMRWQVRPLLSMRSALAREQTVLERLRSRSAAAPDS